MQTGVLCRLHVSNHFVSRDNRYDLVERLDFVAGRQACHQVLRFGGSKYIFRKTNVLFLSYVYNKFVRPNKIRRGTVPECLHGHEPG